MQTLSAALGNASTAKVTTVKALPTVLSNDTSGFAPALAAAKARHAAAKSEWTDKQAALLAKVLGAFPGAKKAGRDSVAARPGIPEWQMQELREAFDRALA